MGGRSRPESGSPDVAVSLGECGPPKGGLPAPFMVPSRTGPDPARRGDAPCYPGVRNANRALPVRSRFDALRPGVEVCGLRFSRLLDVLLEPLQLLVDVEQFHFAQ
jgi:hypothetical protein